MAAIDIGSAAINRGQSWASGLYTLIDKNNPSNGNGKITVARIYCGSNLANCIVGTFYVTSGNILKCRASEAIGTVTQGAERTFNVNLSVKTGDYFGLYFTSGSLDRNTGTGAGLWSVSGQYIDPDDETTYTLATNNTPSMGGIGATITGQQILGSRFLRGLKNFDK